MVMAMMAMVCMTMQAQKVVTVEDAGNMSAKELKQAAKEQKKKENAQKAADKAKAQVVKAQKKYDAAVKAADKAQKKSRPGTESSREGP